MAPLSQWWRLLLSVSLVIVQRYSTATASTRTTFIRNHVSWRLQDSVHNELLVPYVRVVQPSQSSRWCVSSVRMSANDDSDEMTSYSSSTNLRYVVRACTHAELGACADVIMSSFYNYTTNLSPWKQLSRLAELNRLQQGFPYGDDIALHQMLTAIAIANDQDNTGSSLRRKEVETICGFVDIDARIPNRPTSYTYNPRPYLSDLCIHPNFRRRGLAQALVRACEDFCLRLPHHRWSDQDSESDLPELYIRVEATNTAAIRMYEKMGYSTIPNPDGEDILILYKQLTPIKAEKLKQPQPHAEFILMNTTNHRR